MSDTKKYPLFRFRISPEQYDWLRDYASRQGKGMSAIIKEYLESLRRKDEHQREATP